MKLKLRLNFARQITFIAFKIPFLIENGGGVCSRCVRRNVQIAEIHFNIVKFAESSLLIFSDIIQIDAFSYYNNQTVSA